MTNCTDDAQSTQRFDPASDITIEIIRSDECPDGNLPSTFFPGAGSDGALFQVLNVNGPYPCESDMSLALSREDSDNCLSWYDEKTGRGYYRVLDSYAPAQGVVMTLPALEQPLGEDWYDWDGCDEWVEPCPWVVKPRCIPQVDPVQTRIDDLCRIALDEIEQLAKRAFQQLERITLPFNPIRL